MTERSKFPEVARRLIARRQVAQTVDAIASVQQPDGNIPWVAGRPDRPVEPRRSRDGARRRRPLRRGRARVRVAARACSTFDGSWHAYYQGDAVKEHTLDTNVTCYVANGVWHHYLAHRRHRLPRGAVPGRRARDRLRARPPAPDRRDRVGRRPDAHRRQGRAAHRLVEHLLVAALRDRGRRAARPRAPRLGAVARLARHRDRAPARALPRQGTLGDGLVLPDPRRRAARPRGRSARRVEVGHVRRARPRRALRVGPAVDHRGRDVRARDGARRDRTARPRARAVRVGAVPPPRRRQLLDRHELRRRALRRVGRVLHRRAADVEQRGGRARRERARRRRPDRRACSAAKACPPASPPRSSSRPAPDRSRPRTASRRPGR